MRRENSELECVGTVRGDFYRVALVDQRSSHRRRDARIVVDYQDARHANCVTDSVF